MANLVKQFPGIPEPTLDPQAMLATLKAIKVVLDALTGNTSKAGNGLADTLRDLKSATARTAARFTEYVEVSASDTEALARRTTTLETQYQGLADDVGDFESRVTGVETSYSSDKLAYAQRFLGLEAYFDGFDNTTLAAKFEQTTRAYVSADEALAEDIEKLSAKFTGLDGETVQASIDKVSRAFADADEALAEDIEEVRAAAGDGLAQGRIAFRAQAGPDDWSASYSLSVKAANASGNYTAAGFDVLAKINSDGSVSESAIRFNAETFLLYDPGFNASLPVFNYNNGVFTFNVPVIVKGEQLEANASTNSQYEKNRSATAGSVDVGIYLRAGCRVDIFAEFDGQPGVGYPSGVTNMVIARLKANGDGTVTSVILDSKPVCFSLLRINSTNTFYFTYTGFSLRDDITESGQYSYQVFTDGYALGPLAIRAIELFR